MFNYQSTSRFRRKFKKRFFYLKNEFSKSLNDLVDLDISLNKKENSKSVDDLNEIIPDPDENISEKIPSDNTECLAVVKKTVHFDENDENRGKKKLGQKLRKKGQQFQKFIVRKYEEFDSGHPFTPWHYVICVTLIEGENLFSQYTQNSNTYVKIRFGDKTFSSKRIYNTLNPKWFERAFFHIYEENCQKIEITIWNSEKRSENIAGRFFVDLSILEPEVTHKITQRILHPTGHFGTVHFTIAITGLIQSEALNNLDPYQEHFLLQPEAKSKYDLAKTLNDYRDVGELYVKVFKANGLSGANLAGSSNPFCVLELGNDRFQTHAVFDTLSPVWNRFFYFKIKDINDVLDVVIYDEYRDHSVEILGRVMIPLLKMKNGEKKWWSLKDKKLRERAPGRLPHVLLEFGLIWNSFRGGIVSVGTKEKKYVRQEIKFKSYILAKNVARIKVFTEYFVENGKNIRNLLESKSKTLCFIALITWLIVCYYFEPWMIPAVGLCVFIKEYCNNYGSSNKEPQSDNLCMYEDDDDYYNEKGGKSVKEHLQSIPEVTQTVQNTIGNIASILERIKNIFNFSVPYMSFIAIVILAAATFLLYTISLRYVLMLLGINLFFRKMITSNEDFPDFKLVDFIMRVPDDEMLQDYQEISITNVHRKRYNSKFYVKN